MNPIGQKVDLFIEKVNRGELIEVETLNEAYELISKKEVPAAKTGNFADCFFKALIHKAQYDKKEIADLNARIKREEKHAEPSWKQRCEYLQKQLDEIDEKKGARDRQISHLKNQYIEASSLILKKISLGSNRSKLSVMMKKINDYLNYQVMDNLKNLSNKVSHAHDYFCRRLIENPTESPYQLFCQANEFYKLGWTYTENSSYAVNFDWYAVSIRPGIGIDKYGKVIRCIKMGNQYGWVDIA